MNGSGLQTSRISSKIFSIMANYLKDVNNRLKVPRYNLDNISFATLLYSAGPRSYKFLRKNDYPLLSPSTLRRFSSKLCVEPGIQMQTLSHMRSSELAPEEKLCILSFDEMKCREEWSYDRKYDVVVEPKRMVQVAMVRGIPGNWKQPDFYNLNCNMTEALVFKIISELYKIGFTVIAAVSDLGPQNQQLWRSMDVSVQKPFLITPIIKIKNHFVDTGFNFKNENLKKYIIEELMTFCRSNLNIIKTLSPEILNVKGAVDLKILKNTRQKVKLATKLFSHTVSTALIRCVELGLCRYANSFMHCSELFEIINNWFDIFNARVQIKDSRAISKVYGFSICEQNTCLNKLNEAVRNLFPSRITENLLPFQRGILQSNNALPLLQKHLLENYGMDYILTAKLNQDCIENFFSPKADYTVIHRHWNSNIDFGCIFWERKHFIELNSFIFKITIVEYQETEHLVEDKNQLNDIESDGLENFAGYIIS
ncbi:Transposable element P transposase [Lucilia cuprina]|nr:Transposable element P transposase [Lucilia cuprina]